MELHIDNDSLRKFIPNIIFEAEGEALLLDKMLPWIESSRIWLEDHVLGQDYEPSGTLQLIVAKIIIYHAFAQAAPSLDLTLSPSGFSVINTEGRAPASKERVERLIASLNSFVEANLPPLLKSLASDQKWRESFIGQWWLSTFCPSLDDAMSFRRGNSLYEAYCLMRYTALRFESELAERFIGKKILDSIHGSFPDFETAGSRELFGEIHRAELRYISAHISDKVIACPNEHEVWHLARPVLAKLDYWPELKEMWESEMGDKVRTKPFKNSVKGGYYF